MKTSGEDLFWELAAPLMTDSAVTRSTMMGFPCLRYQGRFFASTDRATGALLVKLPAARVNELIAAKHGEPFAPAGRTFREWAAITKPNRNAGLRCWPKRSPTSKTPDAAHRCAKAQDRIVYARWALRGDGVLCSM